MLVPDSAVASGERAKVLDFGIAKLTNYKAKTTATDIVMGTPEYMSPEQCRGAGGVDDRTDVYSLGVMVYEMFAGRTPFVGAGSGEFMGQHMFKEPPPLSELAPEVSAEMAAFVHRLMIKDKTARPSMREVSLELTQMLAQLSGAAGVQSARSPLPPIDARSPGTAPATTLGHSLGQTLVPRATPRRLMLASAAGIAAMGGLVGLLVFPWPAPQNRHATDTAAAVQPTPLPSEESVRGHAGKGLPSTEAAPVRASETPTSANSAAIAAPTPIHIPFDGQPAGRPRPVATSTKPQAVPKPLSTGKPPVGHSSSAPKSGSVKLEPVPSSPKSHRVRYED